MSDLKKYSYSICREWYYYRAFGTSLWWYHMEVNTLRPRQNGRHFADDMFKCIFLNENVWISIKISLKFVPKGPIKYIPALVQIMAWRRPRDKPFSEPMMVRLPTHICVTGPQWVNTSHFPITSAVVTLTPFWPISRWVVLTTGQLNAFRCHMTSSWY